MDDERVVRDQQVKIAQDKVQILQNATISILPLYLGVLLEVVEKLGDNKKLEEAAFFFLRKEILLSFILVKRSQEFVSFWLRWSQFYVLDDNPNHEISSKLYRLVLSFEIILLLYVWRLFLDKERHQEFVFWVLVAFVII